MYESITPAIILTITQIIISTIAAFALLIITIGRTFKNRIDKNEAAITDIEAVITETRDNLFKDYVTKNDINILMDRIIDQLNRIEEKLDHKKDK